MIGIIDKINNFIDKVGKRNFILLIFIVIVIIVGGLYGTFSLFTSSSVSYLDGIKTYKFIIGDDNSNKITIGAMDSKYIDITVSNQEASDLLYSLYYKSTVTTNVIVGVLDSSDKPASGTIKANSDYVISLRIFNNTSSDIVITLGVNYGTVNGGEISLDGNKIISVIGNLDKSGANEPDIDDGMIPVFYDEVSAQWKKADVENMNSDYKWYDYSNDTKMWANVVLVSNDSRDSYLNSSVGTTINMKDVLAFYVWVPRYKYHVWNVSRQGNESVDYSYNAYYNGIEIKFEQGTVTSGNIACSYTIGSTDFNFLSDECKYNNNIINYESNNIDYKDVWYTHPAFNFENRSLSGFWIGKFETTGTVQFPTILPDEKALVNLNISSGIITNNLFKNYGLNSNIDTHILKNIEWGAVAYLSYSDYGLCNDSLCHELYINNSSDLYTGRSGGAIAGSEGLNLNKVYSSNTNSNDKYSKSGYYDYQGNLIDYNGNVTDIKDTTKLASTTGNIYGIYDLAGGAFEYVMANEVDSKYNFNKAKSGLQIALEKKYYDVYSYVEDNNSQMALNKSRLGDAIGEVTFITSFGFASWSNIYSKPEEISYFFNDSNSWLVRGGEYSKDNAGIFYYAGYNGDANKVGGFRSVLS